MKLRKLHDWQLTPSQAIELQLRLAPQVIRESGTFSPHYIAGVDMSGQRTSGEATAAVVVLSYPAFELVEVKTFTGKPTFPYIPGLLTFRELPLILPACEALDTTPDLFLVDGQGIAHPRRFGIGAHFGLLVDKPTIGCAKSPLLGKHEPPGPAAGNYAEIIDDSEVIGAALRTKPKTNPVHVSIGHRIDLQTAIYWVLECCRGYRIPEPLRLAHQAAGGQLKTKQNIKITKKAGHRLFDMLQEANRCQN